MCGSAITRHSIQPRQPSSSGAPMRSTGSMDSPSICDLSRSRPDTDPTAKAAAATARDGTFRENSPEPSTRSEEHTSELQSLMRISYAVFCLKKNITTRDRESLQHHNY